MEPLYIILVALPVSLAAFIAAFWGGVYHCLCFSEKMKMAASFMLFQTALFWLGTWSGNSFSMSLGWMAIPIAEAILLLTGLKFIYAALRVRPEQKSYNLTKTGELIAVSFASGLNAFMIGLGIGLLRPLDPLMLYIIPAGVVVFAYLGDFTGKKLGRIFYATFAGSVAGILIIILGAVLGLDLYNII